MICRPKTGGKRSLFPHGNLYWKVKAIVRMRRKFRCDNKRLIWPQKLVQNHVNSFLFNIKIWAIKM